MKNLLKFAALVFCTSTLAFGQELLRPATDSNSSSTAIGCTGSNIISSALPNAHDAAGLTTQSTQTTNGGPCQKFLDGACVVPGHNHYSARVFSAWSASGNTWASLTVNVNSSAFANGAPSDSICVVYSLNAGSTWTNLRCGTLWSQVTNSATIPTDQDLTKLQVGICTEGTGFNETFGGSGSASITVWDVWTFGTNNIPSPTPAPSNNGRPSDPIIISGWRKLEVVA